MDHAYTHPSIKIEWWLKKTLEMVPKKTKIEGQLHVCLIVCGSKWILDCAHRRKSTTMWDQPTTTTTTPWYLSIYDPLITLTCSNQKLCKQKRKCASLGTWDHRGNQDVKNGMGIGFYSMGSTAAALCKPSQREPQVSQDDLENSPAVSWYSIDHFLIGVSSIILPAPCFVQFRDSQSAECWDVMRFDQWDTASGWWRHQPN